MPTQEAHKKIVTYFNTFKKSLDNKVASPHLQIIRFSNLVVMNGFD